MYDTMDIGSIEIVSGSIVDLNTDAIVNAANEGLKAGGGVCGAIFKAAGRKQLQAACDKIGHCDTGSAVITPGFGLKALCVIHAVGPRWKGGSRGENKLLYEAYSSALELAENNGCESIGFPLISAGIYGYPADVAWNVALGACADYLYRGSAMRIVFAIPDDDVRARGLEARKTLVDPLYLVADKSDWKTLDMPALRDDFVFNYPVTPKQMDMLRRGHVPSQPEDKWFWYMVGNTLFVHRSQSGFCIYVVELSPTGHHKVTVNRDPEQHTCTNVREDAQNLGDLLSAWADPEYDPYDAWIGDALRELAEEGLIADGLVVADTEVDAYYFHLPTEPNGYLSNWYASEFTLDGIRFTSNEQYIMYTKCMVFGDLASAEAVLATDDPEAQQTIGRQAKGYIPHVWEGMRQTVAERGLMAKFSQNEKLREMLLDTEEAWLVECAHSDTTWACGRSLNEPERRDASLWRGTNILGFALMNVRDALQAME